MNKNRNKKDMIILYSLLSQPCFRTICINSHTTLCGSMGLEDIKIFADCRSHGIDIINAVDRKHMLIGRRLTYDTMKKHERDITVTNDRSIEFLIKT